MDIFDVKQIVNILPPSWYFPFLFHFSVEMKQPRNLQQKKTGERKKIVKPITLQRNFLEVTGSRVSYPYARNIYIKVFIEIAIPWMLVQSKMFNLFEINLFENTTVGAVQVFSLEIHL